MLWTGELRINTVHVRDVARALWHLCIKGAPGSVYNLCDKGSTDQKKINQILGDIFAIDIGYIGTVLSVAASTKLSAVAQTANDNHMSPWSDMCKEHNIKFTPLSPYIDKELLSNNNLSIDGSAIEETGFKYEVPEMTEALIREELDYFVKLNLFPKLN